MAENDWDPSKPIDHTLISAIPEKIRDLKTSTRNTIAVEHIVPTTDLAGAQHRIGAARVFVQSVQPTTSADGATAIATTVGPSTNIDDGRLWVDTGNSDLLKVYVSTSAGVSTGFISVAAARVLAETAIDANSNPIVNLATGTVSGNPIHVGQLDTTFFNLNEPLTTAELRLKISTGLATSHAGGLLVSDSSNTSGFTPTDYTNDGSGDSRESITFPNGLILKVGLDTTYTGNHPGGSLIKEIVFDTEFSTGCTPHIFIQGRDNNNPQAQYCTKTISKTGFTVRIHEYYQGTQDMQGFDWSAWGY